MPIANCTDPFVDDIIVGSDTEGITDEEVVVKWYPRPYHPREHLGALVVPTKLWDSRFHAVPSSLQVPRFLRVGGSDQESDSLSIPGVVSLNFALYNETIVFFGPPIAAGTMG